MIEKHVKAGIKQSNLFQHRAADKNGGLADNSKREQIHPIEKRESLQVEGFRVFIHRENVAINQPSLRVLLKSLNRPGDCAGKIIIVRI